MVGWRCCFLCFLRDVSVPEASERFGDPGRLRAVDDAFLERSICFGRPEGVFVPFEEAPDGKFSPSLDFAPSVPFRKLSSFVRSCSSRRSVSESSDSLCCLLASRLFSIFTHHSFLTSEDVYGLLSDSSSYAKFFSIFIRALRKPFSCRFLRRTSFFCCSSSAS